MRYTARVPSVPDNISRLTWSRLRKSVGYRADAVEMGTVMQLMYSIGIGGHSWGFLRGLRRKLVLWSCIQVSTTRID
jgi:hypothetical protein